MDDKEPKAPGTASYCFDRKSNDQYSNMVSEAELVYGTSAESGDWNPEGKKQGEFTLEDYYALPDERRVELIDGVIYDMAAPLAIHQAVLAELYGQLRDFVKRNKGTCKVFPAPFDVQLDMDNRTMVQPDIVVICTREQINRRGGYGAPDFVIEILSESTRKKDVLLKLRKYTEAGVREYWMVDPDKQRVTAYHHLQEDLTPHVYTFGDQVPVGIWDNRCRVDFAELYEEICYLYEL